MLVDARLVLKSNKKDAAVNCGVFFIILIGYLFGTVILLPSAGNPHQPKMVVSEDADHRKAVDVKYLSKRYYSSNNILCERCAAVRKNKNNFEAHERFVRQC